MKFGEFPIYDALGIELAYAVKCQGKTLKKGHVLTSADISLLKYSGLKTITGMQFTSDDVHPETAADILLKALAGDFLRYTHPDETGYSEIFADTDGTFVFDPERLERFVRVFLVDEDGRRAWANPIDLLKLQKTGHL